MTNNMAPLVLSQVPEHLRADSPLFGEFLETYYKYAAQRNKAIGTVQNHGIEMDVDLNSDENLDRFYTQYGQYFPKELHYDKRNFIKLFNKIYEAKGTEKALKLIFRLLFNDEIGVKYPSEQILRASGGVWSQDNFITVVTSFGDVPEQPFSIEISNDFGEYSIPVSKVVSIDSITTRFFYRSFENVVYFDNQNITINDLNGDVVYAGKLIKTPAKLIVKEGGAGWQQGQVVVFNGTVMPTIARVTKVSSSGAILSLEIIEHGYVHGENETLIVSPYPNRPSGSSTEITSEPTGMGTFHYTINIVDQTDGCTENVSGVFSGQSPDSYFLNDYVNDPAGAYTGQVVIAVVSQQRAPDTNNDDGALTIEEWLASRATLVFESANAVKTKGTFYEDSGKLSNQEVRLQDNFYYQPYSYVIQTSKDYREYEGVMGLTHPAGTKRFAEINKSLGYAFNFSASRSISVDILTVLDGLTINDVPSLWLTKNNLISDATPVDSVTYNFSKVLVDDVTMSDEIGPMDFTKSLVDSTTHEDTYTITFSKSLTDTATAAEGVFQLTFVKALGADDSVTETDQTTYALNKAIADSVTADQAGTEDVVVTTYDEEAYFAESYTETQITLTLG